MLDRWDLISGGSARSLYLMADLLKAGLPLLESSHSPAGCTLLWGLLLLFFLICVLSWGDVTNSSGFSLIYTSGGDPRIYLLPPEHPVLEVSQDVLDTASLQLDFSARPPTVQSLYRVCQFTIHPVPKTRNLGVIF